jgi:hypothetical protein
MKKTLLIVAALTLAITACKESATDAKAQAVEKEISYLGDFAEYRVDRNHVWLKFKADDLPADYSTIVRAAAVKAHLAYGSGAHVYLVASGSRLADAPSVRLICSASARYGKIEKSDC